MTDPQHEETFADTERKLREIITTLRAQLAEQIGYKNDYKAAFIETNDDWQEAKARADRAEAALAAQIEVDAEIADRAAHHAMRDGMCYAPDGRSTAYHTVMDQPHDRTALDRYREKALREAADELRDQGYGAAVRTILALIEKPDAR